MMKIGSDVDMIGFDYNEKSIKNRKREGKEDKNRIMGKKKILAEWKVESRIGNQTRIK